MLSEDEATAFRDALRVYCTDAAGFPAKLTAAMRVALASAAAAAQARGVSAEHFVIWVKQAWDELVDERVLQHSTDPVRARDAVVSAAIKAYYMQ
ncbi:MAG: hypothetical protein ABI035_05980 [Gemmatimonadaceae bacterium]